MRVERLGCFLQQLCEQPVGFIEIPDVTEKKLVKMTDLMGREVTKNYSGVIIYQYADGTIEKLILGQ